MTDKERLQALENNVALLALEIAELNPGIADRMRGIAQLIAERQIRGVSPEQDMEQDDSRG